MPVTTPPARSILILVRGMELAKGVPICELLAPCGFNQDIKAFSPLPMSIRHSSQRHFGRGCAVQERAWNRRARHVEDRIRAIAENSHPPAPAGGAEQIVAELAAETAQIEAVRTLVPRYEAKIQRLLARVWGTAGEV